METISMIIIISIFTLLIAYFIIETYYYKQYVRELFKLKTELLQLQVDRKDTNEIEKRIILCESLPWEEYILYYGKFK
jgi:hypothetical protein